MPSEETTLALEDSFTAPLPGSTPVGPADAGEEATVTVVLAPRQPFPEPGQPVAGASAEEVEAAYGADPAAIDAWEAFAARAGLRVVERSVPRRRVVLAGRAGDLARAFGVELTRYDHPAGPYRAPGGPVRVPSTLAGQVVAVLGLDTRPVARPHVRLAAAPQVSYTPPQLASLYQFPKPPASPSGWVGVIELGGGYRQSDLTAYFSGLGLTAPAVEAIGVDGATNSPTGSTSGPDPEVALDIEVVGALVPGISIAVYFAPNTEQGFVDAVTAAVHDATRRPAVVSISWGGPESSWTSQGLAALNQACQAAGPLGVTICVAAGDSGSSDGVNDGLAHVDFPASSPYVLGCGGTTLVASGGTISSEVVWNDGGGEATGGGVSALFPLPSWQDQAGVPPSANPGGGTGRGVPDVSGDADPATGYQIRVDGEDLVVGGTSAVAPLWAGLVTLLNQARSTPLGFLNPTLYQALGPGGDLRDITSGSNGTYQAGPGWDACTGWGSPDGALMAPALGEG